MNFAPGVLVGPKADGVQVWKDLKHSPIKGGIKYMIGSFVERLQGLSLVVNVDEDAVMLWSSEFQMIVWTYGDYLKEVKI